MHKLIKSGFNVSYAQQELENNPKYWSELTFRQNFKDSPHVNTETIYLRGPESITPDTILHSIKAINLQIMQNLPNCVELAAEILRFMQPKEVGRIVIVNLKKNGTVSPHTDEGKYADYYKRFHLSIKTNKKVFHYSQNDYVIMKEGELWEYAHKFSHHTENHGDSDRWNMIFDLRI